MARVVDTNVGVVANGDSPQADPACVEAAVRALRSVQQNDLVVIDDGYHILREYQRYLSPAGQPGPGHLFFSWVFSNQGNPDRCEQVRITPRAEDSEDFEEFPADSELAQFDRSDRKFVAVTVASEHHPVILNATDTDWRAYREPLLAHGVRVVELCPQHVGE